MSYVCDDCGRTFPTKAALNVHPCENVVGTKTSRAIRALADPAQRHLDEQFTRT